MALDNDSLLFVVFVTRRADYARQMAFLYRVCTLRISVIFAAAAAAAAALAAPRTTSYRPVDLAARGVLAGDIVDGASSLALVRGEIW